MSGYFHDVEFVYVGPYFPFVFEVVDESYCCCSVTGYYVGWSGKSYNLSYVVGVLDIVGVGEGVGYVMGKEVEEGGG